MPNRPAPLPPPYLRRALLARLEAVAGTWAAGLPVEPTAIEAIEHLISRAAQVGEADVAATAWFAALDARVRDADLSHDERLHATEALVELGGRIAELEAGRVEADDFAMDFLHDADRLERWLAGPHEELPAGPDPAARLLQVKATLSQAHLPRFAALAAGEALARLSTLLAAPTCTPDPGARRAFEADLLALEGSLSVGEAVACERTRAGERLASLGAMAGRKSLAPLLQAPLSEDLADLHALLGRLEAGAIAPADFHAAFDAAAARAVAMLGWQDVLDKTRDRVATAS